VLLNGTGVLLLVDADGMRIVVERSVGNLLQIQNSNVKFESSNSLELKVFSLLL